MDPTAERTTQAIRPPAPAALARRPFLLLPCLAAAPAAWAQGTERPQYQVGDEWLYDWQLNGNRRRRRCEVVEVAESGVTLRWGPRGELREAEQRSLQLNRLDTQGAEITQVDHPMSVGKQWTSTFHWRNADGSNGRTRLERKVVGMETLHLAKRALECVCIEAKGWWYGDWIASPFEPATGPNNERYWYSPAAKAIVKAEVEAFQPRSGGRRQTLDLTYELVAYRVM